MVSRTHRVLRGSRPVHPPGAAAGRPVDPDQRLQVTIVLKPPVHAHLDPLVTKARAHDSGWPTRRPALTRAEVAALYAPPREVVQAILGVARNQGLTVVDVSEARHDIILEGPVSAFDRAYRIRQREYQHELIRYRGHDEPIHLPARVASLVQGVLGLDSIPHARPHAAIARAAGRRPVTPRELSAHYRFPKASAPGRRRIALLEFGGGMSKEDLRDLARRTGSRIRVVNIRDGEGKSPGNAPLDPDTLRSIMREWRAGVSFAQLARRYAASMLDFMATVEVAMDAEIICGLVPGTPVDLVFASPTADGWRRALYAQLGFPYPGSVSGPRRADADLPSVISASWGMSESDWGRMKLEVLHGTLEVAMRRDVSVCCSTGDFGSRNTPRASKVYSVNYPASSPWALACGGTALNRKTGGGFGEISWREILLGARMAGGGGMSGFFTRPAFQADLLAPPTGPIWRAGKRRSFQGRWLPDVAAHAGFTPGVAIRLMGKPFAGGGTSAATPIWAALLSRLSTVIGRPLGWMAPALYQIGSPAFRDIRKGSNDLNPLGQRRRYYHAGPGWDACTGFGAPDGMALLKALTDGPVPGSPPGRAY